MNGRAKSIMYELEENHFDHVLHHPSSAAVKEHVPATAHRKSNVAFKRPRSGTTCSAIGSAFLGLQPTPFQAPYQPRSGTTCSAIGSAFLGLQPAPFQAPYQPRSGTACSAIGSAFLGLQPTPFQAPYQPRSGTACRAIGSAFLGLQPAPFQALYQPCSGIVCSAIGSAFLGLQPTPFQVPCQPYSGTACRAIGSAIFGAATSAISGAIPTLFQASFASVKGALWSAVQALFATAGSHQRLHGLNCIRQGCSPRGWWQELLPSISDMRCEVPELRGDNFMIWKERILLQLGCMNIDYAIRKDEPHKITDTSTPEEILLYERWEKSNRLSVMYIKTKISASIRGLIEQHENVRELLKAIDEQFITSNKALASTLIMKFTSLKLTGIRGVCEHIMEMRDIVAQLKKLEVEMSESFLVHFILNTLPPQYEPFKISYDSLRIILALVTHYDLELQQMDVKTTFFNGELEEEVYMKQPEGFPFSDGEQLVSGSKVCFLVLYVDDILLATNDKGFLYEVKQFLSKNFDMKDMGEASYVIGIKIHRDRFQVKGDRFNLDQCPKNDLEREQMKNIPYASAVESKDHWKVAKKVMRYLQGTKDYNLMYRRTNNLEVVGYSNLDFAGCVDSRKSTSGYIFIVVGGAISWRSVKQTMTATSTMEVEFISCFEATSHGVWLKSFIFGLRVMDSISRPLSIYCDNSAIVFMAKNNKSGSQSKHIDIKYLAIIERVKEKKVVIEHISTELMIADPLTKGMPQLKFKDHVVNMGLSSLMQFLLYKLLL
ncbi:Retrovirus-related Pol polyprotein from transposon TNT 1-94 [Vitis vinifera]|uniref:Retrovirus-related Pol polyprotein from transposon TNT 1-94 n=1 Tax=Vitis vinifera TaxID=29760 RepID=A0A438FWF2_VITVI|nr:Retrovirus-related Pol polyprotein from transposon TNT 1-94 [Vitis vinifera]